MMFLKGPLDDYTFANVAANHTIYVYFNHIPGAYECGDSLDYQ